MLSLSHGLKGRKGAFHTRELLLKNKKNSKDSMSKFNRKIVKSENLK